jgi:UDP-N-acetyl-D-glucosamine dehydrogenase
MKDLTDKIKTKKAVVGVIGLGYVGLPLVQAFSRAGFRVIGFDLDPVKVDKLKAGQTYIRHIGEDSIREMLSSGRFDATHDFKRLSEPDCILICVPTPLDNNRAPDLSYVVSTAEQVKKSLRRGQLVILESTTYPGTTEEVLQPILEMTGLKAGKDFCLAFSPEREDPNNGRYSTNQIPKVVGGYTEDCLKAALALYDTIVEKTVPVSSTRVAEASKLLENIFRCVNIAMVNELKLLFDRMGIDVWEVIKAASTKPFGFMPFYPGPGLGGHCIPIDPFYLTWKARECDFHTRFIELAGEINTYMPYYIVERVGWALNGRGKSLNGANVLVLGVAYKKNVDDLRESPALKIISELKNRLANVEYSDPYIPLIPKVRRYDLKMSSVPLTPENLKRYDCTLLVTDHSDFDYKLIYDNSSLVVDTRNGFANIEDTQGKRVSA